MTQDVDFVKCKEMAKKVLEENAIIAPPIPIIDIANNYGLTVLEEKLESHHSGKYMPAEHKIIINNKDSSPRQRFTIAHELGHCLLHQDRQELQEKEVFARKLPICATEKKWYETESDFFAAHLLVPFPFLKEMLEKEQNDLYRLAQRFNVSLTMINFQKRNYDHGG